MAYSKEQRIVNSVSGSTKQQRDKKKTVSPTGSFDIPNKSGDHMRSKKRDTPTNDYDLANKKYVDDNASNEFEPSPSTDHSYSGITATMQVDANASGFGASLHMDTDGNFIETDADSTTTMPCMALALETGTGLKKVLLHGFIRDDSWTWTVGGLIYIWTGTGDYTQTAPSGTADVVQAIGVATHADRFYFNPSMVLVEIT